MRTWEVINSAAALIERRGWCQGQMVDAKGCLCLIGGLKEVVETLPFLEQKPAFIKARDAIQNHLNDFALDKWNDAPERTQKDVVMAMRLCAEKLKSKEAPKSSSAV